MKALRSGKPTRQKGFVSLALIELSLVVGSAGCKRWNNGNDSFDFRNAQTKALIGSVDPAWARTILASTCPFRQTVMLVHLPRAVRRRDDRARRKQRADNSCIINGGAIVVRFPSWFG